MNDANSAAADTGGEIIRREQTPGSILRKLREEAGLSYAAVGEALHLTGHYVRALESDEYGKLPGLTFVKGYLRSYARFMQADVDVVIASFEQHIAGLVDAGQRTEQVQRSRRRHDQALRWAIATSVILVLGVAGGWWFKGKDATTVAAAVRTSQPAVVAASVRAEPPAIRVTAPLPQAGDVPQPVTANTSSNLRASTQIAIPLVPASVTVAPPALPEAPGIMEEPDAALATDAQVLVSAAPAETVEPAAEPEALQSGDVLTVTPAQDGSRQVNLVSTGDDLLELSFSGNSWVEIDDGANIRLYNDLLRDGDALTIHGAAPFHLLLGDAANVSVRFNSAAVNIASDIRTDSSARLVLTSPAAEATNIQTANGVSR